MEVVNATGRPKFQSAPGCEAGRNARDSSARWSYSWFQSAPGCEAGRNAMARDTVERVQRFQSAPGCEAGRNMARYDARQSAYRVSIRSRL